MTSRLLLAAAAATALLATGGCGGQDAASAPAAAPSPPSPTATGEVAPSPAAEEAPSPAAAVPEITIADFAYAVPSSVPAGAAVRVVNRDREAHTVTLGGGDGTSVTVAGGASGTLTAPAAAGSYPVGCDFHGDMTSTLVVV